jgi:hypothetical protein
LDHTFEEIHHNFDDGDWKTLKMMRRRMEVVEDEHRVLE